MVIAIVIIFFLIFFFSDFLPVIRAKQKKEIWLYSIAFAVGLVVIFLKSINVSLPAFPTDLIRNIVEGLLGTKL